MAGRIYGLDRGALAPSLAWPSPVAALLLTKINMI